MLVLIRSVGEPIPDVERLIADGLARFGHTSILGEDDDVTREIDVLYSTDPSTTRLGRFSKPALTLIAEWTWSSDRDGTIFVKSVSFDDMGHNVTRGFVDRVGEDEISRVAHELGSAIEDQLRNESLVAVLPLPELLDETEALQAALLRSLADNGDLQREIAAASSDAVVAQLEVEALEVEVLRLQNIVNLAQLSGKGRYVARQLSFIQQLLVLAVTTVLATSVPIAAARIVDDPVLPHAPVAEEFTATCGKLSVHWEKTTIEQ